MFVEKMDFQIMHYIESDELYIASLLQKITTFYLSWIIAWIFFKVSDNCFLIQASRPSAARTQTTKKRLIQQMQKHSNHFFLVNKKEDQFSTPFFPSSLINNKEHQLTIPKTNPIRIRKPFSQSNKELIRMCSQNSYKC